jgi:translation initiation factor 5
MAGYVNIGRTDDPAYRYKMPRVVGKVEGRGNGIKTVIVNIMELGAALHRDPDEVNKFMGCELGAQTSFIPEQERAIVNGAHQDDVLQDLVYLYVDKFVLCPTCKYPETAYKIKLKKDEIYHVCKACGANDPLVDEGHRLCKFILNKEKHKGDAGKAGKKARKERKSKTAAAAGAAGASPADGGGGGVTSPRTDGSPDSVEPDAAAAAEKEARKAEKKAKKAAKKEKKEKKKKEKKEKKKKSTKSKTAAGSGGSDDSSKSGSEDDGEVWASEGTAPVQHHDSFVATASPAEAMRLAGSDLAEFIAKGKDASLVITHLNATQGNYKLKPVDRIGLLFNGVFRNCRAAKEFMDAFSRFKTFFRQLVDGQQEDELMAAFERHFTAPENAPQVAVVPLLLQLFNNEDIVSDDTVRKWHKATVPVLDRYEMVDAAALTAIKAKAAAFVNTLEDSDSSSDSD